MLKRKCHVLLLLCLIAVIFFSACGQKSGDTTAGHIQKYTCPMHPSYTADKPGSCPICGMNLVPVRHETEHAAEFKTTPSSIPGRAPVTITTEQQQHIKLAATTVEARDMARETRTSARVVPAESHLFRVTAKIDGFVEQLFVNATGQAVRKGQPLLSIYSPELYAAQQEFLSAQHAAKQLNQINNSEDAENGQNLLAAARKRLTLWDISAEQIARLEKSGQISKTMTLTAPANGFVSDKLVLAGQKIMAGESLMVIADLSVVWVEADIYAADAPFIQVGMPATFFLMAGPRQEFAGKIAFVSPFLDAMSRTTKARLEIANPAGVLKIDMYGEVSISLSLGTRLALPESAVLHSGEQTYVFKIKDHDTFIPTIVTLGTRSHDYVELLAGLQAGDRVVTAANFLVDSESSLQAALQNAEKQP